jgi:Nif-specific regulatory protein
VQLDVPPLRERLEDVPLLAEHFLRRFVRETGRKIKGFTPAALKKISNYHWPGNVRELRNLVERAVALCHGPMIDAADIVLFELEAKQEKGDSHASGHAEYEPATLEAVERRHIEATLKFTEWNKSKAAAILGIERSTLDRKVERYGITR